MHAPRLHRNSGYGVRPPRRHQARRNDEGWEVHRDRGRVPRCLQQCADDSYQRRFLRERATLSAGLAWALLICLSYTQEDLTASSTKTVLDAFSKGKKPKPGPQSGRHTAENSAGLTALTSKASLPWILFPVSLTFGTVQPYGPGEHCVPEFQ